ncbi:regulator [Methylomonas sp. LL1]|uniref:regulator n=1 Tax=Methylomonas sp. LL1 TaxID=2785785 RepID=UPI0018C37038|nr:regulator [Methylomonas sp. LL1]QPK64666.1 regulator [Methylomonas sp. LL1]
MTNHFFDDTHIQWQTLAGFDHLQYSILDIDENNQIVDVLFKFAAQQQIVLHRHKSLNKTFVIQGEHRLYHADGSLKEIRPVGKYTSSQPSDEPHREGGGDVDVVVFFSIRGGDGVFYQILDDDLNVVGELGMRDFIDLYKKQMGKTS